MLPKVVDLQFLPKHRLSVTFSDGVRGTVLWAESAFTGVFEALRDPAFFRRASIDHGVVTWPNGADLAPDAMHAEFRRRGEMIVD
jgi:hypothetical protein